MRFKSLEAFIYALQKHTSVYIFIESLSCNLPSSDFMSFLPSCLALCVVRRFVFDRVSVDRSPNLTATMTHCRDDVEIRPSGMLDDHAFVRAYDHCQAYATLRHTCAPILRVVSECVVCLVYPFPNRSPIVRCPTDHRQSMIPNPTNALYSKFGHCPVRTL